MRLPKKTKPYHLKDVKFGLVISVIAISIIGVMVIGSAKQAVQAVSYTHLTLPTNREV